MLKFVKFFISVSLISIIVGCGYQPSSKYVRNVFDESVYVEVKVDPAEPENAPYLTDELRKIIIQRFNGKVAPKNEAKNSIIATYKGTRFVPIAYDKSGYITRYATIVKVEFDLIDKNGKNFHKTITATTQEGVSENALYNSTSRILSIKLGLQKASDEFISFISATGANSQ
ncbi:MAG: LPS assembly lipoprotein LptE [Sulfurovaceae bacterium]|nr:LPS assembly lipoprotein LptE [Sulfurovaceae bacterium]MDD5548809.1 LPS assembly lipoprotein LptE [Sulfurovaceae bacterium]